MSVRSPPAKPGYETGISSPSTSAVRPPTNTDDVGGARRREGLVERRAARRRLPAEAHLGVAGASKYSSRDRVLAAGLEPHARARARARRSSRSSRRARLRPSTSEPERRRSRSPTSSYSPGRRAAPATPVQRTEKSSPPSAAIGRSSSPRATRLVGRRAAVPAEVHLRVDARQHGLARQLAAAEVLAAQAVLRTSRGPAEGSAESIACGRARVLPALDEVDARARRARASPGETAARIPARIVTGCDGVPL